MYFTGTLQRYWIAVLLLKSGAVTEQYCPSIHHGGLLISTDKGDSMEDRERKVLLETKLRNLKRKYARIVQHSSLVQEALEIKKEIDEIDAQITKLQ